MCEENASWLFSKCLGVRMSVCLHFVRELDSLTSRITHIRCSSLRSTVRSTPVCGLMPAADRVTHNHVTLHVDGINHLDPLRFRASSQTLLMSARV